MKHRSFLCVLTLASSSLFAAAGEIPKQKKSWIGKFFTKDATHSFYPGKNPHNQKKVTRTVSFAVLPKDETRMPRSQSAPQPISEIALQGVIETPFIPDKLPSLFHEHLFYACFNFLKTQIERLPDTTITDSFPLRIKLYQVCNALKIDLSAQAEKPLEECIKDTIDGIRSELSTIFYTYILETVYNHGVPGPVNDAFHDVFNEIIGNAKLSENISHQQPSLD